VIIFSGGVMSKKASAAKLARKKTRQQTRTSKKQGAKFDLPNHELVVLAVFLVGAQTSPADTEDIAVQANKLAPGRFSWRKYKNQINIETVRKRLWDASKASKGGYLIGSERAGWRLTKTGFDFARRQIRRQASLRPAKTRVRASQGERAMKARELRRMMNETAFLKLRDGEAASITKFDAERFFRLDDYVIGKPRVAKIERFRIIAANNKPLTQAIDFLADLVGGGQ
jgi:hypothetical protein